MKPRRQMEEVKAPEQFQFSKQGQEIGGVLIDIDQVTVKDKPTMQYTVHTENGARFTFLGTNDLDKKIQPAHIGHWLDIRYERDDASFQKPGQSAMKIFKVLVSKEKEPGF
jgi:hypothetical protein